MLQIQEEDIQSAFRLSLEGVHPYHTPVSWGHYLLDRPPSPHYQKHKQPGPILALQPELRE